MELRPAAADTPRMAQRPRMRAPNTIRAWRKARGLTQEELAHRAAMSPSNLSLLETGKIDYTGSALRRLADALDCEPADLLGRKPDDAAGALYADIQSLPEPDQAQIAAIIATFRTRH